MTIPALASGVGVSTTTIEKYIKRGCPRTSIEAVNEWRSHNIKAVTEDADPSEISMELKRAELAERKENARTRQLKNDELEERLIRKEDVERDLSIATTRLKNRLRSLAMRCANLCPAELKVPIKEGVEDTVEICLREFVEDLQIGEE